MSLSPLPIVTVHASFAVMGFHCLEFGKGSEFKEERGGQRDFDLVQRQGIERAAI